MNGTCRFLHPYPTCRYHKFYSTSTIVTHPPHPPHPPIHPGIKCALCGRINNWYPSLPAGNFLFLFAESILYCIDVDYPYRAKHHYQFTISPNPPRLLQLNSASKTNRGLKYFHLGQQSDPNPPACIPAASDPRDTLIQRHLDPQTHVDLDFGQPEAW
jgi:hypothetical protein